ncbi:hypothetical protein TSACC_2535 [Terrimicrobium sacchariphilum]|uniref:Uncharacterized protein n=2 Tax=Terrimicrobium sacchariphilum TaxID=690879 RepID=A0A146G5P6_TERSA|nr:hypothetical protein TSACC_2535 [Terrimicrobium sacchariphilum]
MRFAYDNGLMPSLLTAPGRRWCILAIIAIVLAPLSAPLRADEDDYRRYLAATPATPEQMSKILSRMNILTNYFPVLLQTEVQNGLTDQIVVGAIVAVTYTDPATGKEKTLDVFAALPEILPLTASSCTSRLFDGEEIAKLSPTLTLKEVRLRKMNLAKGASK